MKFLESQYQETLGEPESLAFVIREWVASVRNRADITSRCDDVLLSMSGGLGLGQKRREH